MSTFLKIVIGVILASILNGIAEVVFEEWGKNTSKEITREDAYQASMFVGFLRAALLGIGLWLPFLILKTKVERSDRDSK